jgi:endogenous inhibitor of DNA gyrase (YacG/DUF329 family)
VNAERDAPARTRAAPGSQAEPARKKSKGCPICGKPISEDYRPFCSKRCADIDLGRWLGGRYAVPGEPAGAELAEEDGDE